MNEMVKKGFCLKNKTLKQKYPGNRYIHDLNLAMEVVDEQKELGQSQNPAKKARKSLLHYLQSRRFARKTKRAIRQTIEGFGQEAKESRDMAYLFFRMLENKLDLEKRKTPPTPEEVKAAIDQLKDIGRISVFATISIIPGGGFSLIGLELLARKFGIKSFTFLPSSFQKKNRKFKARSYGRLKQLLPKKEDAEESSSPHTSSD